MHSQWVVPSNTANICLLRHHWPPLAANQCLTLSLKHCLDHGSIPEWKNCFIHKSMSTIHLQEMLLYHGLSPKSLSKIYKLCHKKCCLAMLIIMSCHAYFYYWIMILPHVIEILKTQQYSVISFKIKKSERLQ